MSTHRDDWPDDVDYLEPDEEEIDKLEKIRQPMTDEEVIELLGPGTHRDDTGAWVAPPLEPVADDEASGNGEADGAETLCLSCGIQLLNGDHLEWCENRARRRDDDSAGSGEQSDNEVDSAVVGPDTFFDKQSLCVSCLGEHIERGARLTVGHDDRLYRYVDGVYRPDGGTYLRVQVRDLLGDRFRRNHVAEVETFVRASWPTIGERPPEQYINVANGLLDWRTGELHEHDPEVPSTIQLPVRWDPDASCPKVTAFLRDVLPADAIDFAFELFGYVAYTGNPYRKAVLLLGAGGNGKTQLLTLMTRLVGEENCAAVALQEMSENRFSKASLYGKLANIVGDLDARAVKRTDVFKKITGGDRIEAEHKFCRPFAFTSFAVPVFSANEAPLTSDQSDAWFDRWLVVPFNRRFEGTDQAIPDLGNKLADTPSELEGLLVAAVHGLRRLLARRRFDLPASIVSEGGRYRDRLDTVRGFLADECIVRPDAWVGRTHLYRTYATWAKDGGRLAVSAATFYEHLRRALGPRIDEAKRHGNRGFKGIGLTTTDEMEMP